MNVKTIIVTQVIMTFMMALSMSGIMLFIAIGPSADYLTIWMHQFIIAWPIAFMMTNLVWPIANKIARVILRPEHKTS